MVAVISGVFISSGRANVIARDRDTGLQRNCYVFLDSGKNRLIGSLCREAAHNWGVKPVLVLTLAPPDAKGWHRLEDAELYARGTRTA